MAPMYAVVGSGCVGGCGGPCVFLVPESGGRDAEVHLFELFGRERGDVVAVVHCRS